MPWTTDSTVFEHMNGRSERRFEGTWNHEIAKAIKDDIDGNAFCRFARQVHLKFLTNGIIFPGLIDARNHVQYDIFDETDWAPEANDHFTNHYQWADTKRFRA